MAVPSGSVSEGEWYLWARCRGAPPYGGPAGLEFGTVTHMPQRQRTQRPPIDLAVELERAVERNEFGLEYQPIIDLGSGAIAAVEALLRWRHPLMGTIAPAEYLPLAEETGHIVPIGERVLDAATRQLRTWHLGFARMQGLKVNVNISPRQLSDDDLIPHITTVLQRSDLDPSSLTLELGTGCNAYPGAHRGAGRRRRRPGARGLRPGLLARRRARDAPDHGEAGADLRDHGCRQRRRRGLRREPCWRCVAHVAWPRSARAWRPANRLAAWRSSAATWPRATCTRSRSARRASARCWRAVASRHPTTPAADRGGCDGRRTLPRRRSTPRSGRSRPRLAGGSLGRSWACRARTRQLRRHHCTRPRRHLPVARAPLAGPGSHG